MALFDGKFITSAWNHKNGSFGVETKEASEAVRKYGYPSPKDQNPTADDWNAHLDEIAKRLNKLKAKPKK